MLFPMHTVTLLYVTFPGVFIGEGMPTTPKETNEHKYSTGVLRMIKETFIYMIK